MLRIFFFTSNLTKLAHARYLARQHPITISGFRQHTYHADYFEPRGLSREEMLDQSYNSALQQFKKAGLDPRSQIFFLEDTSVRIDALSTDSNDVPGLEIKYWMRTASFERLNRDLYAARNNRRSRVRSDVLLHIPEMYKLRWKEKRRYRIFSGYQEGVIVEQEQAFDTNLVFPWLDNKTFNKWFQPDGVDRPMGALDIADADVVDFRRLSVGGMLRFVAERTPIRPSLKQVRLDIDEYDDFVLCGYTCAGKTTASQFFARNYGYLHVEASDFMHLSFYQRHGVEGEIGIGDFAEAALTQTPTIVARQVVEYVEQQLDAPMVISGFRSLEEVRHVVEELSYAKRRIRVIFIDAKAEARYERLCARRRLGDSVKFEAFIERDKQQSRMGLDDIRSHANTEIWYNNGSLKEFFQELSHNLPASTRKEIDVESRLSAVVGVGNVKLSDAVLVGLLSVWVEQEQHRRYYSTAEIVRIINCLFDNIQPKHKDNVSRYFNQEFRVYYEVEEDEARGVLKYRLSNTGYGRALKSLRSLTSGGPTI